MSRSLERHVAPLPTGVGVALLTVPTLHKYELVDWTLQNALQAGAGYLYETIVPSSTLQFLDEITLTAANFCGRHIMGGCVLYAGDVLSGVWIGGAGTTAVVVVSYVDVDYT
jgi:hypothetical protein